MEETFLGCQLFVCHFVVFFLLVCLCVSLSWHLSVCPALDKILLEGTWKSLLVWLILAFVNGRHLKKFTAHALKNLLGCSYLLSKYHVKNFWDTKCLISFYFTACKTGILTCKSVETGQIECALTLILKHYKAHFELYQKN